MNNLHPDRRSPAPTSYTTLPLEAPRSRVHSDRRVTSAIEIDLSISRVILPRRELLAASVAAVLARYEQLQTISMGVCQNGIVLPLSVPTPPEATLQSIAQDIACSCESYGTEQEHGERSATPSGISNQVGVVVVFDEAPVSQSSQDVLIYLQGPTTLIADFNARLFASQTVTRFLNHVLRMLRSFRNASETAVAAISIVGEEERAELLSFANGGPPASKETVNCLLSKALKRWGDQPAVEFEGKSWSLKQIHDRAQWIRHALIEHTKFPSPRIGIDLAPGPDQIAALIAVLELGGVIVPLDRSLPASRQTEIRSDARLAAIVTSDRVQSSCENVAFVALEHIGPALIASARSVDSTSPSPDDPLYLMFTSGSTGRAKGVLVANQTLANLIAHDDTQRKIEGKRTLGRTSVAFDVGLQEIFGTILFGGILAIASGEERADIGSLASVLADKKISRVYLPPVALHQLAEASDDHWPRLTELREVIVAGEQLRISPAVRRFFRTTQAALVNQYGPTETHVVTEFTLDNAPLRWPDLPCIGRPIPGVQVYIEENDGELSPILVPGDLVIGGLAPALGYAGLPHLTETRFVANPYSCDENSKIYKSGDRARWLPDGRIEFIGRRDDQVKVRGYRVELGDLESNAVTLPSVKFAAAKFWNTETWTGLSLYLVVSDPGVRSPRQLRDELRARVPDYMVPPLHAIILLDSLPQTHSGKIDRNRLPFPSAFSNGCEEVVRPAERVASIWRRRIGIGEIDLDDDFLDLGGHSLLAIQIVSEVNDALGIGVPLSTLLRGASLRNFTAEVERLLSKKEASDAAKAASFVEISEPDRVSFSASSADEPTRVELPIGSIATISGVEAAHLWKEIFLQKAYHPREIPFHPGATVIDVGANIGLFSRYAIAATGSCRIIAIEPAPVIFKCLSWNLREAREQTQLLQIGLGAADAPAASFSYFPLVPSMSSFSPNTKQDSSLLAGLLAERGTLESSGERDPRFLDAAFDPWICNVARQRLSTTMRNLKLSRVDILKIDVQQGERDVLRGIDDEDWPMISHVVIELRDEGSRLQESASLLKSVGFIVDARSIELHRGTDIRYLYAWRG